mgnify:CR=1 FL=1|tara:strand:- start:360 stop:1085 length:726 start_codon:yes stop_codon:yes gene_type:complete
MIETPYYYFKSAISKENCEKIKSLGLSKMPENAVTRGNKQKSNNEKLPIEKTYEDIRKEGGNIEDYYVRDSKVSWLNDDWIYELLHPFVSEANVMAKWNYEWSHSENCQFTKYEPGGFYSWHQDASADSANMYRRYIHGVTEQYLNTTEIPVNYVRNNNYIGKTRKLSVTLNLSDESEYEGGNLMFDFGEHSPLKRYHVCNEIREQGSIIVFPSFVYHKIEPVTKGTRYSLVMWNLGRPIK